jgi:hypothetical protein
MKYEKFCSQLSTYFKRHVGFTSKRSFRLCWGELERLKPHKKISETGLSWMKETEDSSFWQRKKLLEWYFLIYYHQHYLHITIPSIYLFTKFCLSFRAIFCFINPDYRLIRTTLPTQLIRISEGLVYTTTCEKNVHCINVLFCSTILLRNTFRPDKHLRSSAGDVSRRADKCSSVTLLRV